MIEFVLERYNYWIFIILMMTGLYIVISRGNLVKKIIGLNVFQTSVFIFYISIGKIVGGTAPIFIEGHGGGHGHGDDGHGEDHGAAAGDPGGSHAQESAGLHDAPANDAAPAAYSVGAPASDDASGDAGEAASLHVVNAVGVDAEETANALLAADAAPIFAAAENADATPTAGGAHGAESAHGVDGAHGAAEAVADVVYTNPLPHVLILTAIVVGIATTSVGLALAVRIREAYGTIEEDELNVDDQIAEFGHAAGDAEGAPT